MGNLEKYGVLALIFVIVLILTVAIWNGPGDANKKPADQTAGVHQQQNGAGGGASLDNNNSTGAPGAGSEELQMRPALAEQIRKQQEEEARLAKAAEDQYSGAVAPGGVDAPAVEPLQKAPAYRKYKIVKNDTLQSIAGRLLGAKSRWQEIVKINEGLNPTRLRIGAEILLPPADDVAKSGAAKSEIAPAKKDNKMLAKNTK